MHPTPDPEMTQELLSRRLASDWFGQALAAPPSISLAIDNLQLVLSASRAAPANPHPDEEPGAFREGLWERDCAEAFLLNPANGYYLELNLGPRGSWWACAFSAPRVRATPQGLHLRDVTSSGRVELNSWKSQLAIPLASLPAELDFDPRSSHGNLIFCLGHDPQLYLTACDLGGGQPDFHRPGNWRGFATLC